VDLVAVSGLSFAKWDFIPGEVTTTAAGSLADEVGYLFDGSCNFAFLIFPELDQGFGPEVMGFVDVGDALDLARMYRRSPVV